MKKFRFKLEPVENVRKLREQEALRLLSGAQQQLLAAREYRMSLDRALTGGLIRREELGAPGVSMPGVPFQIENAFIIGTKQRIIQADQAILRATRGVERAMRVYLIARRQTRMIEMLHEKALTEFKREKAKWEQKQLDDLIVMRAHLKHQEGEGAA